MAEISIDDWIEKKNGAKFKSDGAEDMKLLQVHEISEPDRFGFVMINGKYRVDPDNIRTVAISKVLDYQEKVGKSTVVVKNKKSRSPMCTSSTTGKPKIAYGSMKSAEEAIERFKVTFPDRKLNAYNCTVCGKFHVGRPTQWDMIIKPLKFSEHTFGVYQTLTFLVLVGFGIILQLAKDGDPLAKNPVCMIVSFLIAVAFMGNLIRITKYNRNDS